MDSVIIKHGRTVQLTRYILDTLWTIFLSTYVFIWFLFLFKLTQQILNVHHLWWYVLTVFPNIIIECTKLNVYIVNYCHGSMPFHCKNTQTNRWKIIHFTPTFILYVYLDPRNNPQKHAQRVTRHAVVVRYNYTIRENCGQEFVQEPRNFSQMDPLRDS